MTATLDELEQHWSKKRSLPNEKRYITELFRQEVPAAITLVAVPVDDPTELDELTVARRRKLSRYSAILPVRSGRALDTYFMKATGTDLSVYSTDEFADTLLLGPRTDCMIDGDSLQRFTLPILEELLDLEPVLTLKAFLELARSEGYEVDPGPIEHALLSGEWPAAGSAPAEAAAFARILLNATRVAVPLGFGVILEYRGDVTY